MTPMLPTPAAVVLAFGELVSSGVLARDLSSSLMRVGEGFALGAGLGLALGLALGLSPTAERMVLPTFTALRQVPLLGWAPIVVLWCGIGEVAKVALVAIGALVPVVVNTIDGLHAVPARLVEVSRPLELGSAELLRWVILPSAAPQIMSGLRLGLGGSWMLVVWAEICTRSAAGLGDRLWAARESSRVDVVFVCVIVIAAVGFALDALLARAEKRLLAWRQPRR